ncbi:hypothetical protein FHW58_001886 [Duganella sp. 1224]|nr:hypothetical protein [Duganella sp. 1224]
MHPAKIKELADAEKAEVEVLQESLLKTCKICRYDN